VSTKTTSDFVQKPNQESVLESTVAPVATTTEGGQSVDPDNDNDSHQKNDSESVVVEDARASDDQAVLKDT
ncbi:hypothetical protein A2U01_0112375, partial [Trifolium medium]|nr:hypothetical protein [Trifolium medium]